MATAQDETERTFDVPDTWTFPHLIGVGATQHITDPRSFTQTATYFDTPDLTLLRARHTLRHRLGGLDAGWHLKLPRKGDTRREIHEPLGDDPTDIPPALIAHVAHLTNGETLIPVTVLKTLRTRRELLDAQGGPIAEIVDDAVENTLLIDPGDSRWREIELELGPAGTPQDFDLITEALLNSGLSLAEMPSKLGRALAEPLARRSTPPQIP
ncbi:CYTH domain-containing protein [Austwickia chelonae]|uniref:CYTH domain-containing protein n=1 Tax=Austwickia chelonae TaxID=100225 RepID=UPI000E2682BE|nr:CYTH domain-containing protein [Austwickia chelonae]